MFKTIASVYKHIDNGGIVVKVNQDSECRSNIEIEFETQYFGYPSVSAKLSCWGIDNTTNKEFLQALGVFFIDAASKIEEPKKGE